MQLELHREIWTLERRVVHAPPSAILAEALLAEDMLPDQVRAQLMDYVISGAEHTARRKIVWRLCPLGSSVDPTFRTVGVIQGLRVICTELHLAPPPEELVGIAEKIASALGSARRSNVRPIMFSTEDTVLDAPISLAWPQSAPVLARMLYHPEVTIFRTSA